uniref:Uncharacterized protein n=2 Tax=Anas TaxID=8835 RepID=A0A8B9UE16_9AVES
FNLLYQLPIQWVVVQKVASIIKFYLAVPFECRSLNVISFAVLLLKSYIRSLARSLLKFKFEKYMSHFLKKLLFFSWGCVDMCLFLLRTLAKR